MAKAHIEYSMTKRKRRAMKFWRKLEDILLKDIFVIKSPEMKYVEVAAPKTQIELDRDEILGVLGDYLRAIDRSDAPGLSRRPRGSASSART